MLERMPIPVMEAGADGHRFVVYGDSCSGIPGAVHEATFRQVNQVVRALAKQPQFICFPGDEIMGLSADADELRRQWSYFFDTEMAWLDRNSIPLFHTPGNHTTYDIQSEAVYRDVMAQPAAEWSAGSTGAVILRAAGKPADGLRQYNVVGQRRGRYGRNALA